MPWITAMVALPLLGALSLIFVPPGALTQSRIYAVVAALGTLVMTCAVVGLFHRGDAALQFRDFQAWAPGIGLNWDVGVDGISLWLLVLTAALFFLAILHACFRPPARPRGYLALLLLAEAALLGLFSSGNLALFYVFWEAMLVPFYFLIGMWGGPRAGQATLKFVIYTMVGSLLMLVAVLATGFIAQAHTGQFTLDIQQLRGVAFTSSESTWLFAGFAAAFAIKLPLWPLHGWLPDAYSAAPIVVTGLLAAVMSKAAAYGLLRVGLPLFPEGADRFAIPLAVMALIGIVYGSLVAWRAPTMRLLLGYSSLAHLGFIVLGIMIFDLQGAQGAVL
ncbi:MAG: NADH-quinone oxidoreductase subunit, partial [Miltoncostaeaceae bacterium]|nr:NADH-quinone oxidoreductase subunit [Miltoncostaeaceae bacterium]